MTALSMMLLKGFWLWGGIGEILLWIAGVLTFITGYQYFQKSLNYIKKSKRRQSRQPERVNRQQKPKSRPRRKPRLPKRLPVKNGPQSGSEKDCRQKGLIKPGIRMDKDKAHILVVDDDTRLRSLLQRFLRENGFYVSTAKDAAEARERLTEYKFDLLIVDIMMPNETGLAFLEKFRAESNLPVIMLTAMGETADRITGLSAGADDYLPKPFEPLELVLRIKNILKRAPQVREEVRDKLDLGLCVYDLNKKELHTKQGQIIHITPVEQALLGVLGQKSGQILRVKAGGTAGSRAKSPLHRRSDYAPAQKIEKDSKNPRYLQTVRGKGYMLLPE